MRAFQMTYICTYTIVIVLILLQCVTANSNHVDFVVVLVVAAALPRQLDTQIAVRLSTL